MGGNGVIFKFCKFKLVDPAKANRDCKTACCQLLCFMSKTLVNAVWAMLKCFGYL